MIIERVDEDADRIVVVDVFPGRQIGADLIGLRIEREKHRVQIPIIVGDVDVGSLARRLPVVGQPLDEVRHQRHPLSDIVGRFHPGKVPELGRSVDRGDLQTVDRLGRAGAAEQEIKEYEVLAMAP